MKKLLATLAVLAVISTKGFAADGTVFLNNYDSDKAIFYLNATTKLPMAGALVDVLGGATAGSLTAISSGGKTSFALSEAGYFDAGFGVVAGVAEGATANLQVRAWKGAAGSSYASATEKGASTVWTQAIGTAAGTAPPTPPSPATLRIPAAFTVTAAVIPEPSTVILGLLGTGALLFRRRK